MKAKRLNNITIVAALIAATSFLAINGMPICKYMLISAGMLAAACAFMPLSGQFCSVQMENAAEKRAERLCLP